MNSTTFKSLGLTESWLFALEEMKISTPTPIQELAFPIVKSGKDAMIEAVTGSGKTLAYLLPIMQNIIVSMKTPQCVILVPTRELAVQITQVVNDLSKATNIRALSLIGGGNIQRQIDKLKEHPHIVVGTPGRIVELLETKKLKMHTVATVVLDELDQMLSMKHEPALEKVISRTLKDRQLLAVSATMAEEAKAFIKKWGKDAVQVMAQDTTSSLPDTIQHIYTVCERREKIDLLRKTLRSLNISRAMIFVHETEQIAEIVEKLKFHHIEIDAIYGEQEQMERVKIIRQFREGKLPYLLTTDLGARGLDISDLEAVIQFDCSLKEDQYIHRAGRTGRMGSSGVVISFIQPFQKKKIMNLSQRLGIEMEERVYSHGKWLDLDAYKQLQRRKKNVKPSKESNIEQKKKKSTRHRILKTKGAPKWLKNKKD